jgi:hypothetical protein
LNNDERQWLHALARGPLTRAAADRSMPAATRDALLEKAFIIWVGSSLVISARGREQIAGFRGVPADAAKEEANSGKGKLPDLTESQAAWLQNVLDRRFRGETVGWSEAPHEMLDSLVDKGFIWRFENTIEVDLRGVRALKQLSSVAAGK